MLVLTLVLIYSFVGHFKSRKEREMECGTKTVKFTNVYVKNFGDTFTDEKLKEAFSVFGKFSYQLGPNSQNKNYFCIILDREDSECACDEG